MVANTSPIFPLTVKNAAVTFVNSDSTTEKTLLSGGTNGTRIDTISATSDDTVARVFTIALNDGSTSYKVGEVSIPITSGTDGATVAVKVLDGSSTKLIPWLDSSGSIFLANGWSLKLTAKVAVTSGKTITFVVQGGDY